MLSDKVTGILNQQINFEQYSANLYLQMSAWCDFNGLRGCAAFLSAHAAEEMAHMRKLFDYVTETGSLAEIGEISSPPTRFENVAAVFRMTFEHERKITKRINELVRGTFEEGDFSTFNFLQWYVSEQHEEERLFKSILDKIEILDMTGQGLYLFDREVGAMAVSQR